LRGISRFANDGHVGLAVDNGFQRIANLLVVVDDDDARSGCGNWQLTHSIASPDAGVGTEKHRTRRAIRSTVTRETDHPVDGMTSMRRLN
jgi:hypothetical protein